MASRRGVFRPGFAHCRWERTPGRPGGGLGVPGYGPAGPARSLRRRTRLLALDDVACTSSPGRGAWVMACSSDGRSCWTDALPSTETVPGGPAAVADARAAAGIRRPRLGCQLTHSWLRMTPQTGWCW